MKSTLAKLKNYLLLWSTQTLSALGSGMTNYALVVWSYGQTGSALSTALLTICSYTPYVLMSVFAGALTDRWDKKKTMLLADTFAALCTVMVLVLLQTGNLRIGHLYLLNALNGLMNTVQQPASDVAITLLTPPEYYQKASGLRSFSNSLNSILTPVLATALLALAGIHVVIIIDLVTFMVAAAVLLWLIKIPTPSEREEKKESVFQLTKSGLAYLKQNRGILDLIFFLAFINLAASMFDAALPALLLPKENGQQLLGIVNAVSGIAMLTGSILVSLMPAPKSRVRVIIATLFFSMGTENFFLAFGKTLPVWCIGAICGWLVIPMMSANMDVLIRSHIPVSMQGRVYAARNSLQFFTIPLGYFLGGLLVDVVCEPFMAAQEEGLLTLLFGTEKGAGAALLIFALGIFGLIPCLIFRKDKHIWALEQKTEE